MAKALPVSPLAPARFPDLPRIAGARFAAGQAGVKYQGRTVEEDVIQALIMFISSYILILGVLSVAMTLLGVDLESSLFAVWTTLGNVGYGFGPLVARTGTFIDFPDGAIIIMTLAMILGRLGLLAILVLLLPAFWRR